ncbi:MAG: trans-2-enoyl-CoA reductase family protein [Clostridia bacterium]|nr:trans-2-enoyl-CoA reductase family protein [Clostridia bacterium]
MVIEPKIRGFICTTAHPEGCREYVKEQIEYVKNKGTINGAKKVLVIGASMGYGLASRITAAFGAGAATIGVIFDKPSDGKRTATAGWYNTAAFEEFAKKEGYYAKTINGDAFSKEIKDQTIELIKKDLGKVDLVVYSLASPRRTTADGTTYNSVLKTTGDTYTNKTIDLRTKELSEVTIEAANEEEIEATVKVMGGEDWKDWMKALKDADVLEENAVTVAYSYIGPKLTYPVYFDGTIGRAKADLYRSAEELNKKYSDVKAYVSVNKALVTQSSAAIPVVPLYISILYKVMKEKGIHEGCIEQIQRLFAERLYRADGTVPVDTENRIRIDDLEMREDVQQEIERIWKELEHDNLEKYTDISGYWHEFYKLFGFDIAGIDYGKDVDEMYSPESLKV